MILMMLYSAEVVTFCAVTSKLAGQLSFERSPATAVAISRRYNTAAFITYQSIYNKLVIISSRCSKTSRTILNRTGQFGSTELAYACRGRSDTCPRCLQPAISLVGSPYTRQIAAAGIGHSVAVEYPFEASCSHR